MTPPLRGDGSKGLRIPGATSPRVLCLEGVLWRRTVYWCRCRPDGPWVTHLGHCLSLPPCEGGQGQVCARLGTPSSSTPYLPHGQDQECEQQQATQHAHQHPPDGNAPLLQSPKQLCLHLRTETRMSSVTLTVPFPPNSNLWDGDTKPSHLPVSPFRPREARPHSAGHAWEEQWDSSP